MSNTERDSDKLILEHARQREKTFIYCLDNVNLETQCPLDNGKHAYTEHGASVGALNPLPLEITTAILLRLDLPSLTVFRRVNRRAMRLVDSLHEYGMVVKHCPNVLRAILSTNADAFDLTVLYKTLSTANCHVCGMRARYLYLVTCKHVCASCVLSQPLYSPVTEGQFKELVRTVAGMPDICMPDIQDVPYLVSVPGSYGYAQAGRISDRVKLLDYQVRVAARQGRDGMSISNLGYSFYMSTISAPTFDPTGQTAAWGICCYACRAFSDEAKILYTEHDYLRHWKTHHAS